MVSWAFNASWPGRRTEKGERKRSPRSRARARPEIEKVRHGLELPLESRLVLRGKGHGLGEPAAHLDKDEFGPPGGQAGGAAHRRVGRQLDEVSGIVGAEHRLVFRDGARDRLDLADDDAFGLGDQLVDAAVEGDRPAQAGQGALDRDLELRAGIAAGGLHSEQLVPACAQLGAPQARGALGRVRRPQGELGEFADAQAGLAGVEIEVHGVWAVSEGSGRW